LDFMKDDLNTPNAMSVVFEMNKLLNQTLRSKDVDLDALEILVNTQEEMLQILGIEPQRVRLDEDKRALYHAWTQAKAEKDFAQADVLRAQLQAAGVL
ncbi:MAG: DALR domain-containing protein, partial [Erysipelotrichaceae bacterium]